MTENYTNNIQEDHAGQRAVMIEALQWYLDHGVDELLLDTAVDRTVIPDVSDVIAKALPPKAVIKREAQKNAPDMMGAAEAIVEARKIAENCNTLEELQVAIGAFEGLSIKKTATNTVFGEGNPESPIMLIGEAPGADEDIEGKPFRGENGQLMDKILACINLGRESEDLDRSVYMSNVLNWRPPGNRTPTQAEMDISLPFIERHIALVQPKMLIICGGLAGKTLLKRSDTISKIRGSFHDYQVGEVSIPTIVTYHPAYLLKMPLQKKAVWADMLMFQAKMKEVLV